MSAPTEPADTHATDDDDEPINELLPDEPHTPMWLPLLGGVLALLVILLFLMTRPPGKTAEQLSKAAGGATPAASASASAAPAGSAPKVPQHPHIPSPAPIVPHPAH